MKSFITIYNQYNRKMTFFKESLSLSFSPSTLEENNLASIFVFSWSRLNYQKKKKRSMPQAPTTPAISSFIFLYYNPKWQKLEEINLDI